MRKILAVLILLFLYTFSYALTLGDIRSQVRRHIDDINCTSAQEIWTDTELDFLINQGQREIAESTWSLIISTTISLTGDTTYYNLPTDFYVAERVQYNNDILPETTIDKLDRDEDSWLDTSTGTPTNYYINKELTQIGIYPVPSAAKADSIIVWYHKIVSDLSADSDVPFNSIKKYYPYHHLLVYYAVSHILLEQGEENAGFWYNFYVKGVTRMIDHIKITPNYTPSFSFDRE